MITIIFIIVSGLILFFAAYLYKQRGSTVQYQPLEETIILRLEPFDTLQSHPHYAYLMANIPQTWQPHDTDHAIVALYRAFDYDLTWLQKQSPVHLKGLLSIDCRALRSDYRLIELDRFSPPNWQELTRQKAIKLIFDVTGGAISLNDIDSWSNPELATIINRARLDSI